MDKLRPLLIGSIVALIALVVVAAVGGMLMEPSHTVTREATYAQAPEQLWRTITRFDETPKWRSTVQSVQLESGTPVRFVEMGDDGPVPMEVTEYDAPRRLVLMSTNPDMPFSRAWTIELTPVEDGTRVTLTESASIENPMVRFVSHTFLDPAEPTNTYLIDLGRHLGEAVTPQPPA